MQKILVTGANGLVGHYLVAALLKEKFSVVATSKSENRLPFLQTNFEFHKLDYTNEEVAETILSKQRPDVIVHCGAISNADECEQNKESAFLNNVVGTIYLLKAAEKLQTHFIFLSTDFVFDGGKGLYKEDEVRNSVNYYGQTKLLAEDEVSQYPYLWTIARTVLVYGKSLPKRENFVTNTIRGLKEGRPVKAFQDQVRTPTYAADLADGIVSIIQKRAIGIYNIAGKDVLSFYDMAEKIAAYINGDKGLVVPVTEADINTIAKRPKKLGLDISKAIRELGYAPRSFTEGLANIFPG